MTSLAPRMHPRRARILIVEDNVIIAAGLERELRLLGHEVAGMINNASEAVKMAGELKPSLSLMDIGLPGDIDGIAVADAIQSHENIPVSFLTAHADGATVDRAMKASPLGYILKPCAAGEIDAAIRAALNVPSWTSLAQS